MLGQGIRSVLVLHKETQGAFLSSNFSPRKLFLITVDVTPVYFLISFLSQREIYFLLLLWNLQS